MTDDTMRQVLPLYASLELTQVWGAGPLPTTRLVLRPRGAHRYEIARHTLYTAAERRGHPERRNTVARRTVSPRAVESWILRLRHVRIPVLAKPEFITDAGQWTLCLLLGEQSFAWSCTACPMDEASILADFGRWLQEHAPREPEGTRSC